MREKKFSEKKYFFETKTELIINFEWKLVQKNMSRQY